MYANLGALAGWSVDPQCFLVLFIGCSILKAEDESKKRMRALHAAELGALVVRELIIVVGSHYPVPLAYRINHLSIDCITNSQVIVCMQLRLMRPTVRRRRTSATGDM